MKNNKKIYIEASAITENRPSGIGHYIISLLLALSNDIEFNSHYQLVLLIPNGTRKSLDRWGLPLERIKVKQIGFEKHFLQILLKYNIMPPMDLFYGKGIYVFPNYKNWPLLFSKSVTYVYDVAYALFPETIQTKNLQMLMKNLPIWVKRTDMILTISNNSKREIIEKLEIKKSIGVVYCGVDKKVFNRKSESEIKEVKSILGISKDYILFVGNIEPRKNILNLLDAYALLPKVLLKKYALVLIGGDGWENEKIIKRISSLKAQGFSIIHPEMYVPDVYLPALYSGAGLLVHPSIHEGFGMPPLEAMACDTPVAVSDIAVMHEVVGNASLYFNYNRSDIIADTISGALNNKVLRQSLIEKGNKITTKYNWASSASVFTKYLKLVEEVNG